MSGKAEKRARVAAQVFEKRFDEKFESQMPRWCRAVIFFCEGIPGEAILQPYIRCWRERKFGAANREYKKRSLKVLARTARRKYQEIRHD